VISASCSLVFSINYIYLYCISQRSPYINIRLKIVTRLRVNDPPITMVYKASSCLVSVLKQVAWF